MGALAGFKLKIRIHVLTNARDQEQNMLPLGLVGTFYIKKGFGQTLVRNDLRIPALVEIPFQFYDSFIPTQQLEKTFSRHRSATKRQRKLTTEFYTATEY